MNEWLRNLSWVTRLGLVLFALYAGLTLGGLTYSVKQVYALPDPISAEQKVETEYLVVKNGTTCVTVDFVIFEMGMSEDEDPIAVAGGVLAPSERMEFQLPPGFYCMAGTAYRGDEFIADMSTCGFLPDPEIPEEGKLTIFIEEEGICEKPVEA